MALQGQRNGNGVDHATVSNVALAARRDIDDLDARQVEQLRLAFRRLYDAPTGRNYKWLASAYAQPTGQNQLRTPLFLPWNRALLWLFEQTVRDGDPTFGLPYWDWSSPRSRRRGLPPEFAHRTWQGDVNPLHAAVIPPGRLSKARASHESTRTPRRPGELPSGKSIDDLMAVDSFVEFSERLKDTHDQVRLWLGGTNAVVTLAAYDPLFWLASANVDRLWAAWQAVQSEAWTEELQAQLGEGLLAPFGFTVVDVLDTTALGYHYEPPRSPAGPKKSERVKPIQHTDPDHVQLRMLCDAPIDDEQFDVLGYQDYAQALAFVIDHPQTGTPLTLAINAPWGAGKTSLARLTEEQLHHNLLRFQPPITCWFNAWQHDDAPSVGAALAATVARAVARERSLLRRWFDPLPSRLLTPQGRRRRHLLTTAGSLAVALVALVVGGRYTDLTSGKTVTVSVVAGLAAAVLQTMSTVRGTAADVGSLVRSPDNALASGSVSEISDDLGRLVHQATTRGSLRHPAGAHRRVIVFIDDLERCQPPRSIEVCEAVNHLLSHEDVVVVLIGDMQTIATAAEAKYKDLVPRYRTGVSVNADGDAPAASFGELYLEKVVQFRFDLPPQDPAALRVLAAALLGEAPTGEWTVRRRGRLHRLYRIRPSAGWLAQRRRSRLANEVHEALADEALLSVPSLDVGRQMIAATETAKDAFDMLERQLELKVIEGPYLHRSYEAIADYVRPLPRDVKRILNRARFNLNVGVRRELLAPDGAVTPEEIGKWSLLAERWPDLASAVAADPHLLARLEQESATVDGFVAAMVATVPGYARSAELQRLLAAPPALGANAWTLSRLRTPAPPQQQEQAAVSPRVPQR